MPLPATGYDTATVTNPSSALTDFTLMVDLSRMSSSWWAAVDTSDGTKGRAAIDSSETELATDWIDFDDSGETGWLRVKWSGTLASSGTQVLRIYPPQTANSSYAAGDTYGSDNAYDSDWLIYWTLDVGPANDRTGNGNDGTATGTFSDVTGQVDGAKAVTGSQRIASPEVTGFASGYTLMCWGKTTASAVGSLISSDDNVGGVGNRRWQFRFDSSGKIGFIRFDSSPSVVTNILSSGAENDGNWHHLAARFDSASGSDIFVDGSIDGSDSVTTANNNVSENIWACARKNTFDDTLSGSLDDVQVHTAPRSDAWVGSERSQTNDNAAFWGTWTWNDPASGNALLLRRRRMACL